MAKTTKHPEGINEVNSIEITQLVTDFAKKTSKSVTEAESHRSQWHTRTGVFRDLRYGYRSKKTHPWKNSANYSIPLADGHINRAKPHYVNLASATPIVIYVPYGSEDITPAKDREDLFDWRMRTKVDFFPQYVVGIDKMLEQGAVVYKTVWEYSTRTYMQEIDINDLSPEQRAAIEDPRVTDKTLFQIMEEEFGIDVEFEENVEAINKAVAEYREGETVLVLELVEIEHNRPKVMARDLREDIVIPKGTFDIQYSPFIDDKVWMTTNELKVAMRDEKFKTYEDHEIKSWTTSQGQKDRWGYEGQDDPMLIREVCCWYDINDDGIKERCIITYPDAAPQRVLRFIEVPYKHGLFPYVLVKREFNDNDIYTARGYPELDRDYQVGISMAVNQAENNGTIVNSPVVVYQKNSVTNVRNRRYIPGEAIETNTHPDNYQVRQMTNISQPMLLQFAQYLKGWADNRIGDVSAGVSDPTNLPGQAQGGKKTKREIDFVAALQGDVTALDLQVFQWQMAKVYFQIDSLYEQFGDETEEIIITGQEPRKVSRQETQGRFHMVPNGRLDNTNPIQRATKSFNLLKIFANDPDIKQREMKEIFLMDYDQRIARKILYTQQEKSQLQQMKQQIGQQVRERAIAEGIELKQIDTVLDLMKEEGIKRIHGQKYAPDEKEAKKEPAKVRA